MHRLTRGGNGDVWKAVANNGDTLAVKYWLPWVCRLQQTKLGTSTRLAVRTWAHGQPNCQLHEDSVRVKLQLFASDPAIATQALREVGVCARFSRSPCAPACALYSIAGCVDPMPVAEGVVCMELLGPSLAGVCPISSPTRRRVIMDMMLTAALSALAQRRCIPDLKPGNICTNGPGRFLLVDVDQLPAIGAGPAECWATFTIPELGNNLLATMLANLVLTMAMVHGTLSEWEAAYTYHHSSTATRSVSTLKAVSPACCMDIVAVLSKRLTRAMAMDTVGSRLALIR